MTDYQILQMISVILGTIGAWMLAFGMKIRPGISRDLEKELHLEESGLISPSSVRQRTSIMVWGLVMISIAALLQLAVIYYRPNL